MTTGQKAFIVTTVVVALAGVAVVDFNKKQTEAQNARIEAEQKKNEESNKAAQAQRDAVQKKQDDEFLAKDHAAELKWVKGTDEEFTQWFCNHDLAGIAAEAGRMVHGFSRETRSNAQLDTAAKVEKLYRVAEFRALVRVFDLPMETRKTLCGSLANLEYANGFELFNTIRDKVEVDAATEDEFVKATGTSLKALRQKAERDEKRAIHEAWAKAISGEGTFADFATAVHNASFRVSLGSLGLTEEQKMQVVILSKCY